MLNFFKVFGQGVLYIIGLPLILAYWILYSVYCLVMFLYMAFKNIVIFFSGGTPNGDMKEDVEAKMILMKRQEKQDAVNDLLLRAYAPQPNPTVQPYIQQPFAQPMPKQPVEEQNINPQEDIFPDTGEENLNDKFDDLMETSDVNDVNKVE